ncbi:MAG: hypothetical protein GC168_01435 [Candidatus Hydrogenedens sp.]|nr:hypothetical protein [Candidatus Hydrogenedens sp.]
MAKKQQEPGLELKHAVLAFYRSELQRRYQLKNVRRFDSFSDISDKQITELREFFMEQIYPEPAERDQLDLAFDRLSGMLRSPKRMQPLMGAALASLWRIGHRLPAAISAGRSTIDAYVKTRLLESAMIAEAQRLELTGEELSDRNKMIRLIHAVPEKQVMTLIQDILNLFRALTNVEMLKVAAAFMRQCLEVLEQRRDLYSDEDREGIRLGLALLEQGLELFKDVDKPHFPKLINGIHQVELDWYHGVREQAEQVA